MIWLLVLSSLGMLGLALYSRWTEPVLPYGEERHRPLFSTRSFAFGACYGLVVFLWFVQGAAMTPGQRVERDSARQKMLRVDDANLRRRAHRLASAERQLRVEDDKKKLQSKDEEWSRRRVAAVDERAVEEMTGVVLEGAGKGPCATLRGCVCGLSTQFSDSKTLARRYRRWCRSFRSLEGEWMCRSQLQVVKSDLYRNRIVLLEKGLTIPSVCPQRQSN